MASWDITTRAGSWVVTYTNPQNVVDCGATPQDQSDFDSILAWLSDEADEGDVITYGGMLLLQKMGAGKNGRN